MVLSSVLQGKPIPSKGRFSMKGNVHERDGCRFRESAPLPIWFHAIDRWCASCADRPIEVGTFPWAAVDSRPIGSNDSRFYRTRVMIKF